MWKMLMPKDSVTKYVTIDYLLKMIATIENCYKITSTNIVRNGYIHKIKSQGCTFSKDSNDCLFWKIMDIY
jgi:hypothetical protein